MQKVIVVYKPLGLTPLQVVENLKEKFPQYRNKKISYAGRLDPMAEGLLLFLLDEENKKREYYQNLEKEYIFECICGMSTDTYDILGKITQNVSQLPVTLSSKINDYFITLPGKYSQPYPPYSSMVVNKKPLFYWARQGLLETISIPMKEITIHKSTVQSIYSLSPQEIEKLIYKRIHSVSGNFRQREIIDSWEKFFTKNTMKEFLIVKAAITCSSGTYIRSVVNRLGEETGCFATTLSIIRIRVGKFTQANALIM